MGLKKLAMSMMMVRDYQASKDFYGKVLGLDATEVSDEGEWATFKLPGGGAEFAIHGGGQIASLGEGYPPVVPSIEVDDIRSTVEDLRSKGVQVSMEVREGQPGLLLADIKDAEGNVINLYEAPGGGSHGK